MSVLCYFRHQELYTSTQMMWALRSWWIEAKCSDVTGTCVSVCLCHCVGVLFLATASSLCLIIRVLWGQARNHGNMGADAPKFVFFVPPKSNKHHGCHFTMCIATLAAATKICSLPFPPKFPSPKIVAGDMHILGGCTKCNLGVIHLIFSSYQVLLRKFSFF